MRWFCYLTKYPTTSTLSLLMQPSFYGRLTSAKTDFREDDDRPFAVFVLHDRVGAQQNITLELPTADNPNPDAWSALVAFADVQLRDLVEGWDAFGENNPSAEDAIRAINRKLEGVEASKRPEFFVSVLRGVVMFEAALTPVQLVEASGDPATQALPAASVVLGAISQVPSLVTDLEMTVPKLVLATGTDEEPGPEVCFDIPCKMDADPPSWRTVEMATCILAADVAKAWKATPPLGWTNAKLDMAKSKLGRYAARAARAYFTKNGDIDEEQLCIDIVNASVHLGGHPLVVTTRRSAEVIHDTWRALLAVKKGLLFRQPRSDNYRGRLIIVDKSPFGDTYSVVKGKGSIHGTLATNIDFAHVTAKGGATMKMPLRDISSIVAKEIPSEYEDRIHVLEGLTRVPVMSPNGSIHTVPGYDANSRVWYAPLPGFSIGEVPLKPTRAERNEARATITTLFREFPLKPGSLEVAVACLLDQFARPLVNGPRPLFVFDAPAFMGMGSGKTLMARIIAAVVTGKDGAVTTWPNDEDELAKKITASLQSTNPIVIFDNLDRRVDSNRLAALTTGTSWTTRLMYSQTDITLPQTATWILTLNGAEFSRDIARRTLMVQLDASKIAPGGDATKRKFDVEDPIAYAKAYRADVIRACLILLRSWVVDGRPKDPNFNIATFENWSHVVGGTLMHAGLPGLATAYAAAASKDPDSREHELFVARWRIAYQLNDAIPAQKLVHLALEAGFYRKVLANVPQAYQPRALVDHVLSKLLGHAIGNSVVMSGPQEGGKRTWMLVDPRQIN